MLLAIDTATRFASIALAESDNILAECTWQTNDNHSVELMPRVAEMIAQQGADMSRLEATAVALGPGSFTGLRIGLSIAKGLAFSLGIPIVGIPTLDVLPFAVREMSLPTWSVIQAGRGRLSFAEYGYANGSWSRQGEIEVGSVADLIARIHGFARICGELTPIEAGAVRSRLGDAVVFTSPAFNVRRASYLAELARQRLRRGEQDDVVTLTPIYLHGPATTVERTPFRP